VRGLNRDQIVKIARLTGCKNFVGKRKKFAFFDLRWVQWFSAWVQWRSSRVSDS